MKTSFKLLFSLCLCINLSGLVNAQSLEDKFQHVLDSVYKANPESVGIMFHVEAPNHGVSWNSAIGFSNKKTQEKINKNQPALIASNTKTYVAVAILKLIENGKISLNEPIKKVISKSSRRELKNDGYNLNEITIKHLLSHTSGISDYVNDAYFEFVNKHPKYQWNRNEQIKLAMKVGNPLYKAGEDYKYADVNYLLLTEILERKTKTPYYVAIKNLIDFKKHKLNNTWFIDLENSPQHTLPLVHQYWNKYNWDSYQLNPSWDLFGGGGLVATTKDLALFFQLLFEGKIITNKSVLKLMHTKVLSDEKSVYCLGLKSISFFGEAAYYHGGFWGTDVMYLPKLNASISAFTLQKDKRLLNAKISNIFVQLLKNATH